MNGPKGCRVILLEGCTVSENLYHTPGCFGGAHYLEDIRVEHRLSLADQEDLPESHGFRFDAQRPETVERHVHRLRFTFRYGCDGEVHTTMQTGQLHRRVTSTTMA